MVSAVAVLCLVAGLLEGAFSLSCYHCEGKDCASNEKTCEKGFETCMTTLTEITQGKAPVKSYVKSCGNPEMCNKNYSMSLNGTSLIATSQCCNKDKCQTPNFEVQKSTAENNLECHVCSEVGETCKMPIKIKCSGDEKKCATYTARDSKGTNKYISQVCATENLCTMKNISTLPFNQYLVTKFDCTNHATPMFPGLLLPVAILIAMLKLLS